MKRVVLRLGSSGPDVLAVQTRLRANGYSVPLSGAYDSDIESAVFTFQAGHVGKNGKALVPDGKITVGGDATWWALHNPSAKAQQPPASAESRAAAEVAALPAGKVRQLLELALAELGVKEVPDGSNGGLRVDVYTDKWRKPWCAMWVSWCLRQATGGPAFPPHRGIASAVRIRDWGLAKGRYRAGQPASGDIFVMIKPGADGVDSGHGHVGFVVAVEPTRILGISGNDGNAVRVRWRNRSTIAGYVRVG